MRVRHEVPLGPWASSGRVSPGAEDWHVSRVGSESIWKGREESGNLSWGGAVFENLCPPWSGCAGHCVLLHTQPLSAQGRSLCALQPLRSLTLTSRGCRIKGCLFPLLPTCLPTALVLFLVHGRWPFLQISCSSLRRCPLLALFRLGAGGSFLLVLLRVRYCPLSSCHPLRSLQMAP